jgi:hypothetical protein
MNYCPVIGGALGGLLWLALLESPSMGGVIFRKDENGNDVFTPENIVKYIEAPFVHDFFWTQVDFYQHNWIIMCGLGALFGTLF